jgi:hypothetical protein
MVLSLVSVRICYIRSYGIFISEKIIVLSERRTIVFLKATLWATFGFCSIYVGLWIVLRFESEVSRWNCALGRKNTMLTSSVVSAVY